MIQRDLDAVARTFPDSRGSMLPSGMISLPQARSRTADAVPMAIKRFDFLAKGGGDLSLDELAMAQGR